MLMSRTKPKLGLLVAATLIAFAGTAQSAAVFQFDTTGTGALGGNPLLGTNTFFADQMVLTALGLSKITVTDGGLIPNGVIDTDLTGLGGPGGLVTEDTFVETGLIHAVNFRLGGVGVLPGLSGIDVNYQLFIVYNGVDGGPLNGKVALDAGGNAVAQFLAPTSATMWLDYAVPDGVFSPLTSTAIAFLPIDPSAISNCVVPGLGAAQGTCVVDTVMSTPINTVFTVAGNDTEGDEYRIDLNVDRFRNLAGALQPLTEVFPIAGGTQVRTINHGGHAEINVVPEPSILALLGLGLLGLRRFSRKD